MGAYLQAPLQHSIYVTDVNEQGETEYWKLHKALYGLKQAGHLWYDMLTHIMSKAGFCRCVGDEGVFIPNNSANGGVSIQSKAIIGTWVDDLVGIAPDNTDLNLVEEEIEKYVELEHRGQPSKLLGMECHWDVDGRELMLTQTTLIENVAAAHGVNGVKHLLPTDRILFELDETRLCNPQESKEFQRLVGGLLYIARTTRPDTAIQVNLLGRKLKNPSDLNLQAAKEVCRYLLTTRSEGLRLRAQAGEGLDIKVYTDASYGGEQARSQTGTLVLLGNQLVHWYSRRQDTVTLSITEAEYLATCEGAKDASWIMLELIKTTMPSPTLLTDNEAADKLTRNHAYHRRTRHIDHKYHYVRQEAQRGNLVIKGVKGKDQLADPLTKITPMATISTWKLQVGIVTSDSAKSGGRTG